MPGLPWVRMDTNLPMHDKILNLLQDPSPKRWQAASSYVFAICWSGANGTDGRIPTAALGFVHGNHQTARLLVKYGLWDENGASWHIRNYLERQPTQAVSEAAQEAARRNGRRGNCIRWHGKDCGCWKEQGGG